MEDLTRMTKGVKSEKNVLNMLHEYMTMMIDRKMC